MQATQGEQLGPPIIECIDVHKWFGAFHALRGCSLTVQEQEVVVIIGPSGSGKSTFIRCMNRLEVHQRGTIRVNGVTLSDDVRNIDQA
jgi:general L-amino acid transport system ATP-binding protein